MKVSHISGGEALAYGAATGAILGLLMCIAFGVLDVQCAKGGNWIAPGSWNAQMQQCEEAPVRPCIDCSDVNNTEEEE